MRRDLRFVSAAPGTLSDLRSVLGGVRTSRSVPYSPVPGAPQPWPSLITFPAKLAPARDSRLGRLLAQLPGDTVEYKGITRYRKAAPAYLPA